MGQTTANPAMGAGNLGELGDAFGSVEQGVTTKGGTAAAAPAADTHTAPTRGADGRFQAAADTDDDDDEGTGTAAAAVEPHDDDDAAAAAAAAAATPDDDDEAAAAAAAAGEFTLKVNGTERKLTREQVIEAASKGLAANETWQKASSTQKQADDLIQLVGQQRQQLNVMLTNVQTHLNALMQADTADLDTLAQTDPAAWVRQKHLLDQRQGQLRNAMAAQAYLAEQQQQLGQIQRKQFLDLQQEKVLEAIPAWRDREKAAAGVARINTLLNEAGFSTQEIADIGDARIVKVLNRAAINAEKARKYDELRGKSGAAARRVANLPPVTEQPGTRQAPQHSKAEGRKRAVQAWEKAPNRDTLAPLFEGL